MVNKCVDEIEVLSDRIVFRISGIEEAERPLLGVHFKDNPAKYYDVLIELKPVGDRFEITWDELSRYLLWNAGLFVDLLCSEDRTGKVTSLFCGPSFSCHSDGEIRRDNTHFSVAAKPTENNECRIKVWWASILNPFATQVQRATGEPPVFLISNVPDGAEVFFARREGSSHEGIYDRFVPAVLNNGFLELESQPVYASFKGGMEIWDLLCAIGDLRFPVSIGEVEADYLALGHSIRVKPFASEGFLSLFTAEGTHEGERRIRVATMGSCYVRQVFNSNPYFNRDYKRRFECVATLFHQSFCSLTAPASPYDPKDPGNPFYPEDIELYADDEFSKNGLEKILSARPDYIVVDLFVESHATLFCKDDGEIITDAFYLKDYKPFVEFARDYWMRPNVAERYRMFKESCIEIRRSLEGRFDFRNIILVKAKSADFYYDENGAKVAFPDEPWVAHFDHSTNRYNAIFLEVFPEARIIDMRNGDYGADKRSPLVLSRNHFETRYYNDCLAKLEKIVLEDKIQGE